MKTPLYSRYSYSLLLCLQAVATGAEIPKLFNNVALNLPGSWNGGPPGVNDVMLWDATFVDTASGAGSLSPLGGDMSVQGIKVTNVGGTRNQTTRFVGFQNPLSANTLTIGAGGVDMTNATQAFLAQSKILIGADQTWTIGNASTVANSIAFNNNEDLAFQSLIPAATFNLGGKTVTTTGGGYITISSGYVISNGTFNSGNNLFVIQGGGSQVMNLQASLNLIVSSGRLRLAANSGVAGVSLVSAAPVTVNAGILEMRVGGALSTTQNGAITLNAGSGLSYLVDSTGPLAATGAINVAGSTTLRVSGGGIPTTLPVFSGGLTGSAPISFLNTATAAGGLLRFTGDNSAYSGTFTMNGLTGNRTLRLAGANSGSTAATWNVEAGNILQSEGLAVSLGTLNGAGTLTNSHATNPATFTIGAGNFNGAVTDGLSATTGITKTGPGTLFLTGLNNYTGATTINQGSLIFSPDHFGSGAINVADGTTFGTQVKLPDTTLTGGDLTVGSATGATLQLDFGLNPNPANPPVAVTGLVFNGPSTVKIIGKNLTAGTFPVLQYTTLGGTPLSGLTLALPTRTNGSLSDTGFGVNLNITSTEQVKWNGDVSNDWDIDPTGANVVGTPNWLTTSGNAATRYIQGTIGSDAVNFDDSASGGTEKTVNLTATVTPSGLTFDNSAKNYTLTGSGKLSGVTILEKKGTGMVTLANTTANDYTGGTIITAGALRLGDGVTPGAGVISGAIQNEGTLILNRPDSFDFTNALTGNGTLEKAGSNTVSFTLPTTITTPLALTAGKLKFNAGGFLTGTLSGAGELEAAGGTLEVGSNLDLVPNTNTGLTTISGGSLRLNKSANVDALGGNIDIMGAGVLATGNPDQVANTATVRALGTSADSLSGVTGLETYANVVVNGVPTTQLILRHLAVVTGTGTVNNGILGVASAHTATVESVVMTSADSILRVAGGSALSTMNVGSGGITASGGDVQVKFSNTEFPAVLNLAGDLTTTGNFTFSNGAYPGAVENVVNLIGNRVFNIGAGTTTTFAPDLATTTETLTKSGAGTLSLNTTCDATIAGGTTVSDGSLLVNGSLSGSIQVDATGTLGGSGTLSGAAVVDGTVAPGAAAAIGLLTSTSSVTFEPDSDFAVGVGSWIGTTPGGDWDSLSAASLAFTATVGNPLTIHVSGSPTGFTESNKVIVIASSTAAPTGFDPAAIVVESAGFSGTGTWVVQLNGNNIELAYTAGTGSPFSSWASGAGLTPGNNGQTDNPDFDGDNNLVEFALKGDPMTGKSNTQVASKLASVGGQTALTLTLPVRNTATFSGLTEKVAAVDGVTYRIQAGDNLNGWTLEVSEVIGADAAAIQADLPVLQPLSGWTYRTFRSPGAVSGDPIEFIRLQITPTP
ncbi:beta strand repeat-containing protein [Luteolibacter sp. Populi]|uniref:beta strand repeat-containing protein n=1 Tax=Luteolibacter sp. Populi TaxID=3230487 RepID=UPI003465828C